jgi:hypothetical protein
MSGDLLVIVPLNMSQLLQPPLDDDNESQKGGLRSAKGSIHSSQTIENLERFCAFKPQVLANLRFGFLIVNTC